jgi:hypothetical protein
MKFHKILRSQGCLTFSIRSGSKHCYLPGDLSVRFLWNPGHCHFLPVHYSPAPSQQCTFTFGSEDMTPRRTELTGILEMAVAAAGQGVWALDLTSIQ